MAKIVQFEDGKYGVRTYWSIFGGWHFLTRCINYELSAADYVDRHCKVYHLDDAKRMLDKYNVPHKSLKRHRVINKLTPNSSRVES